MQPCFVFEPFRYPCCSHHGLDTQILFHASSHTIWIPLVTEQEMLDDQHMHLQNYRYFPLRRPLLHRGHPTLNPRLLRFHNTQHCPYAMSRSSPEHHLTPSVPSLLPHLAKKAQHHYSTIRLRDSRCEAPGNGRADMATTIIQHLALPMYRGAPCNVYIIP